MVLRLPFFHAGTLEFLPRLPAWWSLCDEKATTGKPILQLERSIGGSDGRFRPLSGLSARGAEARTLDIVMRTKGKFVGLRKLAALRLILIEIRSWKKSSGVPGRGVEVAAGGAECGLDPASASFQDPGLNHHITGVFSYRQL